jgi:hypothetical protein
MRVTYGRTVDKAVRAISFPEELPEVGGRDDEEDEEVDS